MGSIIIDALPEAVPTIALKKPEPLVKEITLDHGLSNGAKTSYKIMEQPSRVGRKLRIIVVGAGASAINFAHEVQESSLDLELTCYDKNPSVGGTWYENRYPGCGCDIPSVNYQLSWAPSSDWSSYYSSAGEILAYFKGIVDRYNLMQYIKLSHRVVGAHWNEEEQLWHVKIQRGDDPNDVFEDTANVFINASGVLNKWKWPAIEGRESFKGPMLHSANWDDTVELKGKRVGVIGSGSSAVQIVPSIQPLVGHMKCFIRSSSWVTGGFAQKFAGKGGSNFKYNEEQKSILANDPKKYLAYRKKIESELNSRFKFILNGSQEQQEARQYAEQEMRRKLAAKPEIADHIVPKNFAVGCRRPTPGNGYLEALCEDNVTVVSDAIETITPRGIRTKDGVEHEFDVLVCATGFDVSWRPAYPTIGRDGKSLNEEWKDIPNTYLSVTVPHFPNYLIFNGPFGPYGHGSFLPITELMAKHFMKMLDKMSAEEVSSFEPKVDAVKDFIEHRRQFLPRTAWSSPCRSWFKQGTVDGEIMMWPGSRIQFFETMENPRWEDYNLTHTTSNRFGYFGNGFAAREFNGGDLSWYLGLLDGEDRQPELSEDYLQEFMA
ncbi:FAD/NAD(P)-binding domain-containing protein [Cucurbitaria berberidis CBS 394.84]|uniref:FAD/NAD(P)-binding domain-containing protein n=1 Tax=Cucurbitaria berberidis CBS 394.84 TaxID=1168544 RepID=A0A9P4GH20_9PLEO|nr:FAD/NAD(P)-binding domain-containing protein [Cucurbitaria berberidis CBS 394.84]KAF1845296.1 FAD/NAD(P)-binding domain-containing protein [Cucurbitaria berberidis CBS 394.84]